MAIIENEAPGWVALDQLYKAELQSINAEIESLKTEKNDTMGSTAKENIQSKIDALMVIRKKIADNYSTYQANRRSKLS